MRSRADLHIHTTASDGQRTPEEVVAMARGIGLCAIAITDHESTLGVAPAMRAAAGTGLLVVPGVEISTDSDQVHILGYFVAADSGTLEARLQEMRSARVERARGMVNRLAALGMPLSWERVQELAGGDSVGRPHIALAMLERGYISSTGEAFALYIGAGGPAYVSRLKVTPAEAIALIRSANGVPVLAHPLQVTNLVPELVEAGLQGLEASYTGYSPEEVRFLEGLSQRHGLVATGGSDYHGPDLVCGELGAATTALATVEQLRLRRPQGSSSWP